MAVVKKQQRPVKITRKVTAKSAAPVEEVEATDAEMLAFTDSVIESLKEGFLDTGFDKLYAAMEDRLIVQHNANLAATAKAATAKATAATNAATSASEKVTVVDSKKLPAAPVKRKATVVPVVGKNYSILDSIKDIGGSLVTFVRLRKDDENKAVVEMVKGAPGRPAGKQIVVPVAALKEAPAARRKPATSVAPARTVKAPPAAKVTKLRRRKATK